jgi:hypothetical protein
MALCYVAPRHGGATTISARGFTHLLVVADKFSKCIEARPIVNVCSKEAVAFFIDVIYRFGIPNTIITDNGQFTRKKFLNFCDDNNICMD